MTPLFLHGAASADMTGWSAVLSALLDGLIVRVERIKTDRKSVV